MIGLIDLDLQSSTSVNLMPPNLEIMKLATYYRIEENKFCRLIPLNETDFTGYEKIYCESELLGWKAVPPALLKTNNIFYNGSAFSNGNYIPFENSIIDFTLPRPAIYKEFLKEKYQEGIKNKVISHILDDTYYRNYAGDEQLPLPKIIKGKRVYLYDRKFFYQDWEETLEKISSHSPSTIIRIHPVICNKLNQFFTLRKYNKFARSNNIILDIKIPLSDVNYMLKEYGKIFLAEITDSSNVFLPLGGSYIAPSEYYRDIIYTLNLLYAFWSKNIPIKLWYIEPKIGFINPIFELYQAIIKWSNSPRVKNKTILERLRKPKSKKDIVIEREQLKKILDYCPGNNDLFKQSFEKIVQGGYWRL